MCSLLEEVFNFWGPSFIITIGPEVQPYRIWAFLCFALANNGILCKRWRVDCGHPCE